MTNREKYITNRSADDLALLISKTLQSAFCCCTIEALTGKEAECPYSLLDDEGCSECITAWLNEEAKYEEESENKHDN